MQTKRCSGCKETKPVSEFHNNRTKKDGLASQCKGCVGRWTNKKRLAENNRRYREANKAQRYRETSKITKKINERSLEFAQRQRLPWEDWEDEFVMADNGLTVYQKAVKLERSYRSVSNRKSRLRKKLVTS